jgi:hypothetical protein
MKGVLTYVCTEILAGKKLTIKFSVLRGIAEFHFGQMVF